MIDIKGIDNFVCINSWGGYNPNPNVEVGQEGNKIYEIKAFYERLHCGNGTIFADVCTNRDIQVIKFEGEIKKDYFHTQIESCFESAMVFGATCFVLYSNKVLHHDLLTIRNTNEIFYHNIRRLLCLIVFLFGCLTKYLSESKVITKLQKICVERCIFLNCLHWSLPNILFYTFASFIYILSYLFSLYSLQFANIENVEVSTTLLDLFGCLLVGIVVSCPPRLSSVCQRDFQNAKQIILCVTNKLYLKR